MAAPTGGRGWKAPPPDFPARRSPAGLYIANWPRMCVGVPEPLAPPEPLPLVPRQRSRSPPGLPPPSSQLEIFIGDDSDENESVPETVQGLAMVTLRVPEAIQDLPPCISNSGDLLSTWVNFLRVRNFTANLASFSQEELRNVASAIELELAARAQHCGPRTELF